MLKKLYILFIALILVVGFNTPNNDDSTDQQQTVESNEEDDVVYNDGFLTKIENTDTFALEGEHYVYIGRKTCPTCVKWLPILEEVSKGKQIYYFDTDIWRDDEKGKEIISSYEIKSVPCLIKVSGGELIGKLSVLDNFVEAEARTELEAFLSSSTNIITPSLIVIILGAVTVVFIRQKRKQK